MYRRLENALRQVCSLTQGEVIALLNGQSPEAVSRIGGPEAAIRWAFARRHTLIK